jgi:TonB-dependent receptor
MVSKRNFQCPVISSVFVILTLMLMPGVVLAQSGGGAITGKVLGPSDQALADVEITVEGTSLSTVSDIAGTYVLTSVPAGEQTVIFSYLGLQTATEVVTVTARGTVEQNVKLAYGGTIEVSGAPFLVGQAKALNRQKTAINITNIVAADQIGRFPDPNAAEAAQRIPAITLTRDQGEGRYVLVRGTEARLNSTTINGERIPSPEAGTRDIALDVIPADLLESIEVSKALTPDMDGDAIGGTVDLVTKRAPEQPRFSATIAGGYNEIVEDSITNGNFTLGRRFNDQRTGVLLSASAHVSNRGSDNFETEYDDGELDELQLRDYTFTRERYGLTFSVDHEVSESSDLFLRGVWNEYRDDEIRRAKRERVGDEELARVVRDRLQSSQIISLTAGGSSILGSDMILDYRVAWNRSEEETPNQVTSGFEQGDVIFDPNVSPGSINPDNIRANPLNEDLAEFEFDELETEYKFAEEEDLVGSINLTRGFYRDEDLSGYWKLGGKARFKEKVQDVTVWVYESEDDLLLLDFLSDWASETSFLGGRYNIGSFQDPGAMRGLLASGALEGEQNLEEDLADFTTNEDTLAAYGMVELAFGRSVSLLGGVRVEKTDTEYAAYELTFDEEGDPSDLVPVSGDKSYTEALPMVHLKYRMDNKSNLRAAITRTLARPNFEHMAPFQLINVEDREIERGNPMLDVTTSWNLDLLYERYLEPLGIVSAGVFYKRLEDIIFISTFEEDRDGETFDVSQPMNGETATLLGFEVAYQNRFNRLPSPWDGLGLYFNYTWSDSEASYPERASSRLHGQAETVGNLALSYEKYGFSGRISFNYNGDYILEVGEGPEEDIYIDEHFQIDLSLQQRISDSFSIFLEVINLGDEPYRVFEGFVDRPIQEEYYGWWGTIGIKLDF